MKLINADKVMEKLEAELYNPEEFPAMELGSVMRMIDSEPEVLNLQRLHAAFEEKASQFAQAAEEAKKEGDVLSARLLDLLREQAENYWLLILDNMNTKNEHYSTNA